MFVDNMHDILNIAGSIFMGVVVGYVFVGLCVYKPVRTNQINDSDDECSDNDVSENEETKSKELQEFQNRFFDELSMLKEQSISNEIFDCLKKQFIEVETPEGLCIMNYDKTYESFTYYCDNKSIAYKTLDSIAREYAVRNNCKEICVNYKEEYEKAKNRLITKELTTKLEQIKDSNNDNTNVNNVSNSSANNVEQQKSPFAKLKNYKTIVQQTIPKTQTQNDDKSSKNNDKNANNNKDENVIVINKANKFKFCGLIKDFVDPNKPVVEDNIIKLDYNSFKKMMEQKKEHDKQTEM